MAENIPRPFCLITCTPSLALDISPASSMELSVEGATTINISQLSEVCVRIEENVRQSPIASFFTIVIIDTDVIFHLSRTA
jgi:hypothetical protein